MSSAAFTDPPPPQEPAPSNHDIDDEEDGDFTPSTPTAAHNGNSSGEDADDDPEAIDEEEVEAARREREETAREAGGEDRLGKRRRTAMQSEEGAKGTTDQGSSEAQAKVKAEATQIWGEMKAAPSSASTTARLTDVEAVVLPSSSVSSATGSSSVLPDPGVGGGTGEEDLISVPQTYTFAGTSHTATKLLPRSHPDTISYFSTISSPSVSPSSAIVPSSNSKPGPRRKKTSSLAVLSAAATTSKPTKLNTLEKSKMDWDKFKSDPNAAGLTEAERDEIEAQTKGGGMGLSSIKGYLERKDFLDRVGRRVEEGQGRK